METKDLLAVLGGGALIYLGIKMYQKHHKENCPCGCGGSCGCGGKTENCGCGKHNNSNSDNYLEDNFITLALQQYDNELEGFYQKSCYNPTGLGEGWISDFNPHNNVKNIWNQNKLVPKAH